ncbi:MAG: transcriptional regulator, TetR family [Glaciihabitans sp.]|nr:transcriptional regulator, TetR family [Glaciihabitans sp.]
MVEAQDEPVNEFRWDEYPLETDLPQVLRHARDAFVKNGYHGTTVRDIAKRLGQTVPAIYYHYENKQALLVALLTMSIDDLLERCAQAESEAPNDPVERLSRLVSCIVLYTANRREMAFLDAEIRSLDPENRQAYVLKRDRMQDMVTRVVTEGMESKAFLPGDSHAHARAIITMLRGIANWYHPGGHLTPEDVSDQYINYTLRLVGYDRS